MSAKDEEREYCWTDDRGDYYYMNRFMGFRFPQGTEIPEEYKDKPEGFQAAKELLGRLFKETEQFDTKRVESLNIKQIGERTEKSESGKTKYVKLSETAFNPNYLKTLRRVYKNADWYVRPDKEPLSNLYVVDPGTMETVAVLMPMRIF